MSLSDVSIYFTEKTLDEVIRAEGGTKCTSWEFTGGFTKGDSYQSVLHRMNVNGVKENGEKIVVNLVVKSLPRNAVRVKSMKTTIFFRNECNFYQKVWPKLEKFQAEKEGLKEPFLDIPKFYAQHCDGKNDFIAFGDLSKIGFGTCLRQNGLNFQHCKLILEALGRFHALSLAFSDQNPEEFKAISSILEDIYYTQNNKPWYNDYLKTLIEIGKDAILKECGETEFAKCTLKFLDGDFYDKMMTVSQTRNKYSAIIHFDCWTPNFMFQYETDENGQQIPTKMKLIDFQMARYNSTVMDIAFFIYSCTTHELREKNYDELIEIYHNSVTKSLKSLGSDPNVVFPMEALQSELMQFARIGCGICLEAIPVSLISDEDSADLDNVEGDEALSMNEIMNMKNITDKEGRLRLANVFKHAYKKGYLN